jgi:hypothetical protein
LSVQQIVELLLELLLIEQLTAGRAIDARAQFGDTIFVGGLLFSLSRNEPFQEIVAESEVGGSRDRPARHDHDGTDKDPKCDRAKSDLTPSMGEDIAGDGCRRLNASGWTRRQLSGVLRSLPRMSRSPAQH